MTRTGSQISLCPLISSFLSFEVVLDRYYSSWRESIPYRSLTLGIFEVSCRYFTENCIHKSCASLQLHCCCRWLLMLITTLFAFFWLYNSDLSKMTCKGWRLLTRYRLVFVNQPWVIPWKTHQTSTCIHYILWFGKTCIFATLFKKSCLLLDKGLLELAKIWFAAH